MQFSIGLCLAAGALTQAGIAYPAFARAREGWKVGAWANSSGWTIWFGAGLVAYLWSMWHLWTWWGVLAAWPVALVLGFLSTSIVGRNIQLLALLGPPLGFASFFATHR